VQQETGEAAPHRPAPAGPRDEVGEGGLGGGGGPGEAAVGGLLGVGHPGDHGEDRRRVLGPAGDAEIDLGDAAVTVPVEERRQAELRQLTGQVTGGELRRRCAEQELAVPPGALGQPPEGEVHLDGDVVRHAGQDGVDVVRGRDALEQLLRQGGGQHARHDRPGDGVGALGRAVVTEVAQPVGGGAQLPGRGGGDPQLLDGSAHPGAGGLGTGEGADDPGDRASGRTQRRGGGARCGTLARGEPRIVEDVRHGRLGAGAEVHRHSLDQAFAGGRVARLVGEVAVEPPADVDDLGPDAEGRQHAGDLRLEGGQAHRRHRLEHALHVTELDVHPGLRAGLRGQREQGGDRPRLEQPQRAGPVHRPLHVLGAAGPFLQPLPHRPQPLEQLGRHAPRGRQRGSGLAGYDVYRDGTLIGSPTTTSFAVTGLSAATHYEFTVAARDAAGNRSARSAALAVTTAAGDTPTGGTCRVAYSTSDWSAGFTGSVSVTNTGTAAIGAWSLQWSYTAGQLVTQGWSARATQTGTVVTATGETWSPSLAPGRDGDLRLQRQPRIHQPPLGGVHPQRHHLHDCLTEQPSPPGSRSPGGRLWG
jgi:chitodextrinase